MSHVSPEMSRAEHRALKERAWPLERFDPEHRARIQALVDQPKPPPRWLRFERIEMESRAWYEWYWQRGRLPQTRDKILPSLRRRVNLQVSHSACNIRKGSRIDGT